MLSFSVGPNTEQFRYGKQLKTLLMHRFYIHSEKSKPNYL